MLRKVIRQQEGGGYKTVAASVGVGRRWLGRNWQSTASKRRPGVWDWRPHELEAMAHGRGGYNSDDITKVGGGGALEPGGSDDGMTITITISSGSSGKDDSELQAILAKCVKK